MRRDTPPIRGVTDADGSSEETAAVPAGVLVPAQGGPVSELASRPSRAPPPHGVTGRGGDRFSRKAKTFLCVHASVCRFALTWEITPQ